MGRRNPETEEVMRAGGKRGEGTRVEEGAQMPSCQPHLPAKAWPGQPPVRGSGVAGLEGTGHLCLEGSLGNVPAHQTLRTSTQRLINHPR